MRVTPALILFCAIFQPLMAVRLTPDMIGTLIPASFPDADRDPSNYTIRYLSQLNGNDSVACLENQLYSATDDDAVDVEYCRTLEYSLTGEVNVTIANDIQYLILIISPATYVNRLTKLYNSHNIILVKNPLYQDEVIIHCEEYSVDVVNSLLVVAANFALIGVTFSHCGPLSPAVIIIQSVNITVDSCNFK